MTESAYDERVKWKPPEDKSAAGMTVRELLEETHKILCAKLKAAEAERDIHQGQAGALAEQLQVCRERAKRAERQLTIEGLGHKETDEQHKRVIGERDALCADNEQLRHELEQQRVAWVRQMQHEGSAKIMADRATNVLVSTKPEGE